MAIVTSKAFDVDALVNEDSVVLGVQSQRKGYVTKITAIRFSSYEYSASGTKTAARPVRSRRYIGSYASELILRNLVFCYMVSCTLRIQTGAIELSACLDLYKTRIQTLLNNVVEYTSPSPELEPLKITISNGFDSQLDIELQHYVASDENALTHTIFRGLEAGMIYPTARSTSFALRPGTLTAAKIDQYCERMACDMILKESASSTQNRLLNHVILFAVTQINREDVRDRIEGVCILVRERATLKLT